MSETISQLIIEISGLDCSFEDSPFFTRMARVQKLLGQEDGMFADIFFFGHNENWKTYSQKERRDLLVDYVRQELSGLVAIRTE